MTPPTTSCKLKVVSRLETAWPKKKTVRLLARNVRPDWRCRECGEVATQLCGMGEYWEDGPVRFCDRHAGEHARKVHVAADQFQNAPQVVGAAGLEVSHRGQLGHLPLPTAHPTGRLHGGAGVGLVALEQIFQRHFRHDGRVAQVVLQRQLERCQTFTRRFVSIIAGLLVWTSGSDS